MMNYYGYLSILYNHKFKHNETIFCTRLASLETIKLIFFYDIDASASLNLIGRYSLAVRIKQLSEPDKINNYNLVIRVYNWPGDVKDFTRVAANGNQLGFEQMLDFMDNDFDTKYKLK